jgi:2-polyprenyl-3-methyl-5-hydroxy-6-metoxy-1,4-benzoquinol methylase
MKPLDIDFDKIHTEEKQKLLSLKMTEVSDEIHRLFSKNSKENSCPVCNSKKIRLYSVCFGFDMDRCEECFHIFTNPFPTLESLSYYYNSDLKEFENKFFLESFENRIPIFTRRIEEISKFLNKSDNLLDVGSAIGIFIESNKRLGDLFQITACDLNKSSCNFLKEKYPNIEVLNENIYELSKSDESFAGVSLWDTVEHLTEPKSFLAKIRKLLRPGGYFFFSTPNTNSFEWKIMGKNHVQLLPPGHVNLYNTDNIQILLKNNGFELVEIKTLNASLDISYVKKMYQNQKISSFEKFFLDLLNDDREFYDGLCDTLIRKKMAGNMFIIARKY